MSKLSIEFSSQKKESNDYPSTKKSYSRIKSLGKGSYGEVFLAKITEGKHKDELVAIKILDLDSYYTENWETIGRELTLLRMVWHPNLIRSLQTFVHETELRLVMPYMDGGSCSKILKSKFPNGIDDEIVLATVLRETLLGLTYLHEDGRIHRDLKSANILLSRNGEVKLSDFGLSRCLLEAGEKKGLARTFTGTPCWMAPEVMKQEKGYDYKADIWSFGITALEMAFGKPPYAQHSPMKIMMLTLKNKPPSTTTFGEKGSKISRSFKNMVDICLKKDAARRPTAKELLKHKFLKKSQGKDYLRTHLFDENKDLKETKTENMKNGDFSDKVNENDKSRKAVSVGNFKFFGNKNLKF